MTISRMNPSGWVTNDPITPAQINGIDVNTTLAPDFTNGGTYAPSATVNVGGSGITLSGTGQLQYASRSITRVLRAVPYLVTGTTIWRLPTSGETIANTYFSPTTFTNLTNVSNEKAIWEIEMPTGATLTSMRVATKAAAGHAAFPGGQPTFPTFVLKYMVFGAVVSTPTIIATGTDASASAAAYEAQHYITASAIGFGVDSGAHRYFVELTHESGANYIAGAQFYGVEATFTITKQTEL